MSEQQRNQTKRGALLSFAAYLLLTVAKLVIGYWLNSRAVLADGINNLTDTGNMLILLIGMFVAEKPADDDHRYGHWKAETISALIVSLLILLIGGNVLLSSGRGLFQTTHTVPATEASWIGGLSAIIMLIVYFHNAKLSKKLHSIALQASAHDNFSDALTSLGTTLTVILAQFQLPWLDTLTALLIGLVILKSGFDIFKESVFSLTDGFDQGKLDHYALGIMNHVPRVRMIRAIRGRQYGAHIYLDITILVDGSLSVDEGHAITEDIERYLQRAFGIDAVDVHVEPFREPYNQDY